ncbi:hypothetical protein CC78DRAFT_575437 [Lojkania enalia]|uniref:Uncharacterized protein n=1 Tax=Lojkania enalia TaxID=147567 RepID=A0A9P4KHR8_9PLEO|nr:hypothetical protein CC78DRAFT_575437 [Didymosphaeria enalia]
MHTLSQSKRGFGTAMVHNNCDYDVWVWSVDQSYDSGPIFLPAHSIYLEPIRPPCCEGCGTCLKVSKTNKLIDGLHLQFEYAIKSVMYYDISFVNCAKGTNAADCPGHEKGLQISSPEPKCGKPTCEPGEYCPTQAYYVDTPLKKLNISEPVFGCGDAGSAMDLHFTICKNNNKPTNKRSIFDMIAFWG